MLRPIEQNEQKRKKKWIAVLVLAMANVAQPNVSSAAPSGEAADTMSAGSLTDGTETPTSEITMGELPHSTQGYFEKPGDFLYLSMNVTQMGNSTIVTDHYVSTFGDSSFSYPSLDYFGRIAYLAPPEGHSSFRDFSIWGRFTLGMGVRKGQLDDKNISLTSLDQSTSLLVFTSRFGLMAFHDTLPWLRPALGLEYAPYYFRNTSSLSGAEVQGVGAVWGPVLGLHFPVLFQGRASLYAEARHNFVGSGQTRVLGSSTDYNFGAGVVF